MVALIYKVAASILDAFWMTHLHYCQRTIASENWNAIQECAVQFPTATRRWFLANHLVRRAPDKWIRFFRAEALERWNQLGSNDVPLLNGDRDGLIGLLQDRYSFAHRRAEIEVDDFISTFQKRMQTAIAPVLQTKYPDGAAIDAH